MEKVKYNCCYDINNSNLSKFRFRIIDFILNGKYYNCATQNIYNDWMEIYFDRPLDIEEIKYSDVQMEYNDGILIINDDKYIVRTNDLQYFVSDIGANFEDSLEDIMINFCSYLIEHISDL